MGSAPAGKPPPRLQLSRCMSGPGAICTDVLGRFRAALEPSEAQAVSRRLGELLEAFRTSCSSSLSALNQAATRIRGQISGPLFPDGATASALERLGALEESLRAKRETQQALDKTGVREAGETWVSLARESAKARAASDEAWRASFSVRRDAAAREHSTALELYRSVLAAYQRATGASPEGRSGIPSLLDEWGEREERKDGKEGSGRAGWTADLLAGLAGGEPGLRPGSQPGPQGDQGAPSAVSALGDLGILSAAHAGDPPAPSGGAGGAGGASGANGAGGVARAEEATATAGAHGLDALLLDF